MLPIHTEGRAVALPIQSHGSVRRYGREDARTSIGHDALQVSHLRQSLRTDKTTLNQKRAESFVVLPANESTSHVPGQSTLRDESSHDIATLILKSATYVRSWHEIAGINKTKGLGQCWHTNVQDTIDRTNLQVTRTNPHSQHSKYRSIPHW